MTAERVERRGAKPGERRGGRRKGTPNKRTAEREQRQQFAAEAWKMASSADEMRASRRKLGKEIAGNFANVFAGMAAYHQPVPAGQPVPPGREPNVDLFIRFAELAVWAGSIAAKYESPTYRAVFVETDMQVAAAASVEVVAEQELLDVTPEPDPADLAASNKAAMTYLMLMKKDPPAEEPKRGRDG